MKVFVSSFLEGEQDLYCKPQQRVGQFYTFSNFSDAKKFSDVKRCSKPIMEADESLVWEWYLLSVSLTFIGHLLRVSSVSYTFISCVL